MLDRLKDEKILMSLSLTVKVKLTEEVNRGDVIIHHGIKDAPEERGGGGWARSREEIVSIGDAEDEDRSVSGYRSSVCHRMDPL